jgi:hypothetical protein
MAQLPYPDDPVLRALAEHWDDVLRLASDDQRELLRGLVAGTVEPDPIDARAMLADVLLVVLPADHPLVDVLRTGTLLSTGHGSVAEVEVSLRRLRSLVLVPEPPAEPPRAPAHRPAAGPAPGPVLDEFDREVRARLLALPALSPDELRERGVDPAGTGLIRLVRQDLEVQLPAFQFSGAGRPWPVVLEVNGLLNATADPWGVMCWWVDPHAGLDLAPVDLLGQGRDRLLVRAAAAVGDED